MKFDRPATVNPIDRGRVVGQPLDRIDGPAKVSGAARYAYEHNDAAPGAAYGWIVGASIRRGRRIAAIDLLAGPLGKGEEDVATIASVFRKVRT